MEGIEIRQVTELEELYAVQKLERLVWKMEPIPIHQTITAVKNGGLIAGAFLGGKLIGYSYSFAGFSKGQPYLCSHMLAVDPDYQLMGVGKMLKDRQLEIARTMGYELIVWTFDPLESRNAYLNTAKLYGVCYDYIANCYGEMKDGLNKGLPTDRFQVAWWINSPRVNEQWQPKSPVYESPFTAEKNAAGHPVLKAAENDCWLNADAVEVPVPEHIQLIKAENPELAHDWRIQTREIFTQLCNAGFALIDVRRTSEFVQYYRFYKKSAIPLTN